MWISPASRSPIVISVRSVAPSTHWLQVLQRHAPLTVSQPPVNTPTKAPTGTDPLGATHDYTDPSHYYGTVTGGIDIEKATNGVDADTPTGPMIPAGNTVTWTYVVTNTTNVDLTGITVTDSDIGPISCPVDTLAPGASTTCTATGVATAGQYANEGTATGTDPLGATHDDTDPSHYYGTVTGGIEIEKATNGVDADTPTGPTATRPATP